jgi:histidinol dehydrogenase
MELREVSDLSTAERAALFDRDAGVEAVREDAADIVARVREEGDVALRALAEEIDDVTVGNLDVTDEAERAHDRLDDDLRDHLERAAGNVRTFHEAQVPEDWRREFGDGRELGRRYRPIERVGAYVPGGTAAYPSSALMTVLPATVAGVEHVVACTPPADDLPDATLAALHVAGADRIYQAGGAGAVAAMAYGTETVDRVEKIVGPGNAWVTAAKAEVRGDCEIDFLAGPSEVLVVADASAEPRHVAADLLAQAEHDTAAAVAAVTDDRATGEAVVAELDRQLDGRARVETIRAALDGDASGVFLARSMPEAVAFAESYAAEHLSVQTTEPDAVADRIDSAGSVFLGEYSPVAAGDYAAGPNHVLPTGGLAAVQGGLSVDTFLRSSTVQRLSRDGLADLADTVTALAETEGLEAHAHSVRERFREDEGTGEDENDGADDGS